MNEIIFDIFPFINIKCIFIKDRLKMLHNYRGTDYAMRNNVLSNAKKKPKANKLLNTIKYCLNQNVFDSKYDIQKGAVKSGVQ